MNTTINNNQLDGLEEALFDDIMRRINDIDNAYRSIAEKAGQLYMKADEAQLVDLTGLLDKPMRNASDNHQSFAALLEEMQLSQNRRKQAAAKATASE